MKPGGVVSLKRFNSIMIFRNNKLFVFLCLLFIIGIFTGTFLLSDSVKTTKLAQYFFSYYIGDRDGIGFFAIFFDTLLRELSVCIVLFILGTSIIGAVLSPIACSTAGLYFGFLSSYIYKTYALKGVAFNAIILIPAAFVFVVGIIFAAKESFNFSVVLLKLTFPKSRPQNISSEFKLYCGKYLLVSVFLIIASLIDAAVSTSFLVFFNF